MTIYPITPKHPAACYGMGGFPHHSNCQRYQAVEDSSPHETVSTCSDGRGGWPWFVEESRPNTMVSGQPA